MRTYRKGENSIKSIADGRMIELKFTCSAPRWAGLSSFLRDLAFMLGIKSDIESEKGLLTEKVRCRIEGDESRVMEFKRRLLAAGRELQSQLTLGSTDPVKGMNTTKTMTQANGGSSDSPCSVRETHRRAVSDLYRENGVGHSVRQKLAFWDARLGPTFISHNPTDEERLAIHEQVWISESFPAEIESV